MRIVSILDAALRAIDTEVAAFAPERGGALLTLPGRAVVTGFLLDEDAVTTSVSYRPSRELNRRVQNLEAAGSIQFGGILHSHPGGLNRPSGQDECEIATGLRVNPHLEYFLAPIVTLGPATDLGPHELPLTGATLSFFAAVRDGSGVTVRRQPVRVLPLLADLERVAAALGATVVPECTVVSLDEMDYLVGQFMRDGLDVQVLVDEQYPVTPPLMLATRPGGATEQIDLAWRLELPPEERLLAACTAAFGTATSAAVRAGLFARSAGLLSESLGEQEVLIVGLGSVGSQAAEGLVRGGVGRVTLIDPDTVEPANLSRTVYRARDIGLTKVAALSDRLRAINPALVIDGVTGNLLDLEPVLLDTLVRRANLVLAATDDPAAQRVLNRFAYGRGKPSLFVGLYAGAEGGEVVYSVPGRTPCYLCATFVRHAAEADSGAVQSGVDYSTGRLPGEVALGADIQHVVSAGVKLAFSLLLPGPETGIGAFLEPMLSEASSYLTLGMAPGFWFYPEVFGKTIGQYAYQSVWLTPSRRPECPVCGENQADPLSIPLRPPQLVTLRKRRPPVASESRSEREPPAPRSC